MTMVLGDDDPNPGRLVSFYRQRKTKSLKVLLVIAVFIYIYLLLSVGVSALQETTANITRYSASPSGIELSKLSATIVKPPSLDKVIKRKVASSNYSSSCTIFYPLIPSLRHTIMAARATCSEKQLLAKIAHTETTGGLFLKNPASTASGPYQFLDTTWNFRCRGNKSSFKAQTDCALRIIRSGDYYDTWERWWR